MIFNIYRTHSHSNNPVHSDGTYSLNRILGSHKDILPHGPVKILVKAGQVLDKPEIINVGENQDVTG